VNEVVGIMPNGQNANGPGPIAADATDSVQFLDTFLVPDPTRVVLRPFIPAEDQLQRASSLRPRVQRLTQRVLALTEGELNAELARVLESLARRHLSPRRILRRRFYDMAAEGLRGRRIKPRQQLLIGAYFLEEYSFEAAALFNPSVVAHPDQTELPAGSTRLLLSLRGVGEGHVSSIVFRTAELTASEMLRIEPAVERIAAPHIENIPGGAPDDPGVRLHFGKTGDLSSQVISPITFRQRHGLEDLRLVRFTEEDGHCSYVGTYTAFSGESIRQEILLTSDFVTYELNVLRGVLSATKGMALFPRRIDGRYAMLGRQDHENIWLLRSNELYEWQTGEIIVSPRWPWEFIQMGNCGSPIEIDEGWLVVTHGVGAIRNYCLGACLLDKRDPSKLIARSTRPLFRPNADTFKGYVPNVAYSCGAFVRDRMLLLPFGVADTFTAFAKVSVDHLLGEMR
jgi:predicted GH43/DUF377 family glycosyl hydrolase